VPKIVPRDDGLGEPPPRGKRSIEATGKWNYLASSSAINVNFSSAF